MLHQLLHLCHLLLHRRLLLLLLLLLHRRVLLLRLSLWLCMCL
jgi:hypothetical protein